MFEDNVSCAAILSTYRQWYGCQTVERKCAVADGHVSDYMSNGQTLMERENEHKTGKNMSIKAANHQLDNILQVNILALRAIAVCDIPVNSTCVYEKDEAKTERRSQLAQY